MSENSWAVLISVAVTAAVAAAGALVVGWLGRRRASDAALGAPVVVVLALGAGVAAATRSMLISEDNYRTVLLIVLAGAPIAIVIGMLLARRVHALEASAARARAAYERDLAVESQRRELVGWLSHDLRTPLSGIRLIAESLRERTDGRATEARELDRLLHESDRLAGMVEDLAELSRLQAGGANLNGRHQWIALGDLVSDAVAAVAPLAAAGGVTVRAGAAQPADVEVDVRAVTRAVINIVRNAVQHTTSGGVVTVSHGGRSAAFVCVEDGCGGIPDDALSRVFEPGWRGDAARTSGESAGMGLGLAIAREVARAHRGEIVVANLRDGSGCAVTLTLGGPVRAGEDPDLA